MRRRNAIYSLMQDEGVTSLTDYLTEQEQIQQLKNWLKQYGPTIIAGVVLALGMSWGWHYYQNYRNNILAQASLVYDEMLGLQAQGKNDQRIGSRYLHGDGYTGGGGFNHQKESDSLTI